MKQYKSHFKSAAKWLRDAANSLDDGDLGNAISDIGIALSQIGSPVRFAEIYMEMMKAKAKGKQK